MSEPILTTSHLSKKYEDSDDWLPFRKKKPITAVEDVSLRMEKGELFGLLGPNGAGKTTLVKILSTLIAPTSGTFQINGFSQDNGAAIRSSIGLAVNDERSFYFRITCRQNLLFFMTLYGIYGAEAEKRAAAVLEEVDLTDRANVHFRRLSSGMKQRMAIARALLHRPSVIFLDEPSRSLDPIATERLHDLILSLTKQRNMSVFMITHDLNEAEKLCDRVAVMHKGRIRTVGQTADLRRHLKPVRPYLLEVSGEVADFAETLQIIEPLAQHLHYENGQLRFEIREADQSFDTLLAILRQRGVTIEAIESAPPTLEEVFKRYTVEA